MLEFLSPSVASLLALLTVILVSLTGRINVGVLAVVLAGGVGVFVAQWPAGKVAAAFPSNLFLTLVGVTLLFGAAEKNGTLEVLTRRLIGACRGRARWLPVVFFGLASVLSAVGPGAIASTALVAPLAMAAGARVGVPAFLMALMVGNGANAGNLSPFSAVGVIVHTQMDKAGLPSVPGLVFLANFLAHVAATAGAYVLFGGLKLGKTAASLGNLAEIPPLQARHIVTLGVLTVWIASVLIGKVHLGLAAFAAAAALILLRAVEDGAALRAVPWSVIIMVCGVSVLIGVLEETGGIDLFTTLLSQIATPGTVNGVMAFVTGLISTYSSTSGVVYPAFLPAATGLVEKLGGGDALEIALSINVGAALVDVSPLSTLGALCIAALPAGEDPKALFRRLLLWGFSMTLVGAIFCQLFIGWFTP